MTHMLPYEPPSDYELLLCEEIQYMLEVKAKLHDLERDTAALVEAMKK